MSVHARWCAASGMGVLFAVALLAAVFAEVAFAAPMTEASQYETRGGLALVESDASVASASELTAQSGASPAPTAVTGLQAKGCSLIVKWRAVAAVNGYQIAYSTSSNMRGATVRTMKGASKTSLVVKGVERGKTYYVKVRTCKGANRSAWSAARSLKMRALSRTDLTRIVSKASAANKGKKKLKVYNSTYQPSRHKAGKRLLKYIRSMAKGNKINIVMTDLTSGDTLTYSPKRSMYSASCLKGPFVASLNKWKPRSRSSSSGSMRETIVWSNNDTYAGLRGRYGSSTMRKMHKYSGIGKGGYSTKYRFLPTRDLAKLWVGTYWYFYKDTNKNSKWARSLYTHGSNSFIYSAMKGKKKVHAKPGWYPGGSYNVRNDAGVVMAKVNGKSRPYVVAVMSSAYGQYGKLAKLVKLLDAVHTDMVKRG